MTCNMCKDFSQNIFNVLQFRKKFVAEGLCHSVDYYLFLDIGSSTVQIIHVNASATVYYNVEM